MHITLEADYAIRIVHCLSMIDHRADAKSIAETTGVTLRFSLKILRKLVAAGIIKSFKGTQGGYEIAKLPSEISLYDVIVTIEGPLNISRCVLPDFICTRPKEGPCKFQKVFVELSDDITSKLKAITFDQMM
ncbi:BadM/Rrf2 family transcriptional regulator [Hydrogenoanaerobacterium saccharovorans]|uniref:Transcriptional regulator, BadM/Rrf2 family n=1 Tax=Hydrogenoanaerobacterium saccharovorans TaxID=474960 RepID=A0A1H8AMC0_9FIRM|nr:Rrf2 family transcriptional regulator [Hydrogenoanaerobacterium saccharovorans]RPF47894.1 BadM/Rrf2 family transcriptional regulator [Hydrogenoanaerobacterium saccharovorans]SEM71134.1 transcriptional regulator, BadM/Rrf2 family [Hydrogenoanaerobacterium saccharovorans]